MRSIPFYPLLIVLLVGSGSYLGCDPNQLSAPLSVDPAASKTSKPEATNPRDTIPARTPTNILIGSFNLQRLGPSKISDSWVTERFADIIRKFDVIALQEITSKDQRILPALISRVNSLGNKYNFTIGPQVGRASSGYFEQYAFVYDETRILSGPGYCYPVLDEKDILHREPFVGRFQSISPVGNPFQFTLINMHTDPDEINTELDVLADVYRNVRQYEYPNEDDVLLVGDLNAPHDKLRSLNKILDFVPLIRDLPTNVRKSKMLDNILIDRLLTTEFTGRCGTIDLQNMFRIELVDALKISDHLPIWAEFSIIEQPRLNVGVAGQNQNPTLR